MSRQCFEHYLNEVAKEVGPEAFSSTQRDLALQAAAVRAMSNTQHEGDRIHFTRRWISLEKELETPARRAVEAFCESRGYCPVAQN